MSTSGNNNHTANNNSSTSNGELKPSDFEVPAACVNRIIKSVLADNVMITKDARAAIVRAVSIFIFYITHGANDFSREAKRQTIFPIDIINSLK
jgi:histone H3/H4